MRRALIAGLAILVMATGWLGWRDLQVRRSEGLRTQMVAAGRDGLLALTTIDHQQVDVDVQRILDNSTGSFREDFETKADGFKDAARKAQSTSVGTVTEAGLESADGDSGQVLVALRVMTTNRGVPERQPKTWRTRVTVTKDNGEFRVAAVEFVP
ncbi:MAG: mammalian cell entry protein [Mycobacterium sp.]|nr:mammalian cell entry protein [Mycobacterium sp.]